MHRLVSLSALLLCACSCGATTAAEPPFTAWAAPGLRLERRCVTAADLSECRVVGIEGESELEGRALWARVATGDDPNVLARRAIDVLLAHQGQEPLTPDFDRTLYGTFVSDAEWAIVRAPSMDADWVVLDLVEGEMSPTAMRIRVHVPSGTVERTALAELASLGAEPIGPALCAPVLDCGCDRGCVRVEPVPPARGSERFREGTRLLFRSSLGWMEDISAPPCEESCPPPAAAAPYTCTIEGDHCTRS